MPTYTHEIEIDLDDIISNFDADDVLAALDYDAAAQWIADQYPETVCDYLSEDAILQRVRRLDVDQIVDCWTDSDKAEARRALAEDAPDQFNKVELLEIHRILKMFCRATEEFGRFDTAVVQNLIESTEEQLG